MKEKSTKASQEAIKNTSTNQSAASEANMEGGREAASPEAPAPKRKRAKPKTLQEARADEGMEAEAAEAEDRNRKRAHRNKTGFDPEKTSLEYLHDISRSLERIAKKLEALERVANGLETLERIERSREKRVLYGLVDDGFF